MRSNGRSRWRRYALSWPRCVRWIGGVGFPRAPEEGSRVSSAATRASMQLGSNWRLGIRLVKEKAQRRAELDGGRCGFQHVGGLMACGGRLEALAPLSPCFALALNTIAPPLASTPAPSPDLAARSKIRLFRRREPHQLRS